MGNEGYYHWLTVTLITCNNITSPWAAKLRMVRLKEWLLLAREAKGLPWLHT